MIRTVGIKSNSFNEVSAEYVVNYFKNHEFVQYDSETTGLSLHDDRMICFQLGDYDNQYVISTDNLKFLKHLLETKTLIGHNIKFDLGFLYKDEVYPSKVFDTFLAEAVINCGLKTVRKNLAAVAQRRLGIEMDKSVRNSISKEGLSDRVIEYAANDVKYLNLIMDSQMLDITAKDLKHALEVENRFVKALAYVEFCGFKLDRDRWVTKMTSDFINLEEARGELEEFTVTHYPEYINIQSDLFSSYTASVINWASPKQVSKLFREIGIPISTIVKGVEKETVEAKHIEKHANKFPIIKYYLKYKEYEKIVNTYGESFIKQINSKTGRLHTNFQQVMDTGRLSSGGAGFINFQNIPSDKETRSCFVADEGNSLVVADYSGQEQVVLANRSLDESLLEFYDGGHADMHSFVASKMYKELEGVPLDDIKTLHKDKRQAAKTAGFAINYGGVGATIAKNNNLSLEEGNAVYDAYFEAFPGLRRYFEDEKRKVFQQGYIQFNDIIRTKSFIENYDEFVKMSNEMDKGFWERWKLIKQSPDSEEYKNAKFKISLYFKMRGAIERKSLNFPIQGTSATITKISGIYFFDWIRENNLLGKVLITNIVHDENVVESPDDMVETVALALKDAMVRAGAVFCKRVPLKVDVNISKFWKK